MDVRDGSITGMEVQDGTINGMDVQNEALGSADVRDGSLTAGDFAPGMLPPGPPGPPGPSGATNITVARSTLEIGPNGQAGGWASCPAGKRVTGGGVGAESFSSSDNVIHSGPVDADLNFLTMMAGETPTAWYVRYFNSEGVEKPIQIYATCAAP